MGGLRRSDFGELSSAAFGELAAGSRAVASVAVAFVVATALGRSAWAAPSPVAHWKLDETTGTVATDETGSYDGTVSGTDFDTSAITGKVDGALTFAGTDDYVNLNSGILPNTAADMTEAAWIRTTTADRVILTRRHRDAVAWPTLMVDGAGKAVISVDDSGYRNDIVGTTTVTDGKWHHVVGVKQGTTYSIYVDGQLENSGTDGRVLTSDENFHVGHHGAWNRFFNGDIDDVRIYNQVLSDDDILTLFEGRNVSVTATDAAASEVPGETGTFRISRTGGTDALTVNISVTGDAGAADYTASPVISGGTVVIPLNESYVDVTITPNSDTDWNEPDETVTITILASGDYIVGSPDSATVTIVDYTPPVPGGFLLTSPIDGEQNAGRTPTFTWRPSSDADDYTVALYPNDSMTAGTEVYSDTVTAPGASYVVPAAANLAYDTEYWWKVTAHNDVTDTLASNAPFSFYTTAPGDPTVLSTSPSDGASDVPVSTNIRIAFSEPMQKAATEGAFTLVDADSLDVPGNASLTANGMTLIFTPDPELLEEATYTATLTTAAIGLDGNALDAEEEIVFTTEPPLTGFGTGDGCLAGAGSGVALWALLSLAAAVRRRRA